LFTVYSLLHCLLLELVLVNIYNSVCKVIDRIMCRKLHTIPYHALDFADAVKLSSNLKGPVTLLLMQSDLNWFNSASNVGERSWMEVNYGLD